MRVGKSDTSKRETGPIPEWPATKACQFFSTPVPKGVINPKPVTATRRCSCSIVLPLLLVRFYKDEGILMAPSSIIQ